MKESRYKLVAFDMDGVLTQNPSSWGYVHRKLGVDNSRNLDLYKDGAISYMDFLKRDVLMWIDRNGPITADTVIRILDQIPIRDGIANTLDRLADNGISSAIISGGIYWLAEKLGMDSGFLEIHANKIKTDEKNFIIPDGEVMVDPKRKDLVIMDLQTRLGVSPGETVSIGDTMQDAAMFRYSGLPIAFNPVEESVSEKASVTIRGNDLSAILDVIVQ